MKEILLIRIEDQQYAVWKDEVESVTDVQTLHRLPLSPSCIAGMSIIDGRTITLADLPVCIGRASANGKARVLMLSGNGKVSGFLVRGDIEFLPLAPEALLPMPGYLRTEVIDSCAILDSAPVPVINLHQLAEHLLNSGREQPRPPLSIEVSSPRPAPAKFRLFNLNNELFAADAQDIEDAGVETGRTAVLSAVPRYVKGIVLHERTLLPLIDLAQRISLQPAADSAQMLIATCSGAAFGLLVDQDLGARSLSQVQVRSLPPLARSCRLSAALEHAGGIVPVIDIAALLSQIKSEETPLDEQYHPDSSFPALFGAHEVDVLEFSLLGARHALPKTEVKDVISIKPWRALPGDAPEIMIGVAEHEGEILPVLDLAMVFGRRSITAPEWRMMVVRNGDFRALVITETVFGERRLPLEIQRAVPILLPHRVVYGCYPETEAVRLILNVEALAVHFEKSLVQELLPALSAEMKQAPARIVPSLLQDAAEADQLPVQPRPEAQPLAAARASTVPAADAVHQETAAHVLRDSATTEETPEEHAIPATSSDEQATAGKPQEAVAAATPSIETAAEENQEPLIAPEPVREGSVVEEEKRPSVSEEPETEPAAAESAQAGEKAPEHEAFVVTSPDSEMPVAQAIQESDSAAQGPSSPALEEKQKPQPEPVKQAQPEPESEPEQAAEPAAAPAEMIGAASSITEAASGREQMPAAAQQSAPLRPEEFQPAAGRPSLPRPAYRETSSEHSRKKWISYAAAAAILIGLLYFAGTSNKPSVQKSVRVAEREAGLPAAPKAESASVVQKQQPAAQPRPEPRPSLVLDIPKSLPVSTEVYIVVKGDTLWGISERFTGNPFNYPRIAGENRIADPDLIFPGQKIRLLRK